MKPVALVVPISLAKVLNRMKIGVLKDTLIFKVVWHSIKSPVNLSYSKFKEYLFYDWSL